MEEGLGRKKVLQKRRLSFCRNIKKTHFSGREIHIFHIIYCTFIVQDLPDRPPQENDMTDYMGGPGVRKMAFGDMKVGKMTVSNKEVGHIEVGKMEVNNMKIVNMKAS
jgi:hypothetical protein